MSDTHRCRRSCLAQVRRDRAFCGRCWRRIPPLVQRAIWTSWRRVQDSGEALDVYGDHARLLLDVEAALEGDRTWGSVVTP